MKFPKKLLFGNFKTKNIEFRRDFFNDYLNLIITKFVRIIFSNLTISNNQNSDNFDYFLNINTKSSKKNLYYKKLIRNLNSNGINELKTHEEALNIGNIKLVDIQSKISPIILDINLGYSIHEEFLNKSDKEQYNITKNFYSEYIPSSILGKYGLMEALNNDKVKQRINICKIMIGINPIDSLSLKGIIKIYKNKYIYIEVNMSDIESNDDISKLLYNKVLDKLEIKY